MNLAISFSNGTTENDWVARYWSKRPETDDVVDWRKAIPNGEKNSIIVEDRRWLV